MRIFLTGVAGSLGSFLLDELLKRGHYVHGVDNLYCGKIENINHNIGNPNFTFEEMDLSKYNFESMPDVDCVCHFAALKKIGDKAKWLRTDMVKNNQIMLNLVKETAKRNKKLVFTSTSDVYGCGLDLPFREDGNLTIGSSDIPRWDYAASKMYDEHVCFAYRDDFGLPVTVIRYFGVYSERARWEFGEHVPLFIKKSLEKETITIHGDGLHTRSMCFIDDAIDLTVKIIETDKAVGEIINVGSDEELSILESAKIIWETVNGNQDYPFDFVPMENVFGKYKEIQRRVPDLSKAKKLFGYQWKTSFRDGIEEILKRMESKNDRK